MSGLGSNPVSRISPGPGTRSRARLARAGRFAHARGLTPSRAGRFAGRLDGSPDAPAPAFADLAAWPSWPALEAEAQHEVFALAALLSARDALAQVISGSDLRRYAAPFGSDLFERALALRGGGARTLPPPTALAAEGEVLARSGLPASLAACLGESLAGEPEAARHVAEAEGLLRP